ncbi:glycosyltransferase family 2 protein [Vannielia litorea]|nr:glycosyltransferase family 2 protein [Vannielia litorea]
MRIAVGAITRRRPEGLRRLLESLARMERPEGTEIAFLFCENDDESRVSEVVDAFRQEVAEPVELMLEPTKGIPFARNRVLTAALEQGFDFLTFVDDDEVVEPGWLANLLAAMETRKLDLGGGPVDPVAPDGRLTPMQQAILDDLIARAKREADGRASLAQSDGDQTVDVYTNNWCLRLAAVRERNLYFDTATAESGGEDTKFSQDMLALDSRNGWVPGAWVAEAQTRRRLTLSYQYRRMRDQTRTRSQREGFGRKKSLKNASQRYTEALALLLVLPAITLFSRRRGRETLVRIVRKAALAAGLVGGTLGMRSYHYAAGNEAMHLEDAADAS